MKDSTRDLMLRVIEATFVAIPRPDCTKRVAEALDDEWIVTPERAAELRQLDTEQQWQDLKPKEIYTFSSVLFWISPEGFRFYFPAFLRYSIENWHRSHDLVQKEVMEVIGRKPVLVNSLTAAEARVSADILTELWVDPRGDHYDPSESIQILEARIKHLEQTNV
jgi:hypothetical protein